MIMDKRVTTRFTSSPGEAVSPAASKNDSFLEDMELFSNEVKIHSSNKEGDRHFTRRTLSPVVALSVVEERDVLTEQHSGDNVAYLKIPPLHKTGRKERSNNEKAQTGDGILHSNVVPRESKSKIQDSKSRGSDTKSKSKASENQTKIQNEQSKSQQEKKNAVRDQSSRRSGSFKESFQSCEASKENKQPSNSRRQSNSNSLAESSKDHQRRSDSGRKIDSGENLEPVALLSAVKEVVSIYTKEEGMKILRTLNELHILSQASLIKNLMFATDEIRKDLQLGENLGQLKVLMAENERLKENFAILKMKNEDLQRRLEDSENIKEENARLKIRLQEINGRKTS